MKRFGMGLLVCLICLALLAGCAQAPSPAAPVADEVTTTTTAPTTTAATTVPTTTPFPLEGPYRQLVTSWGGAYYWIMGENEYGTCNAITTRNGQILITFDGGPSDPLCSLAVTKQENVPVRFLINGNIYDGEGNCLTDHTLGYTHLDFDLMGEELYILAEDNVGYFLLDADGQIIKQLDTVQFQEVILDNKYYKTIRPGFAFNRYGVRNKLFHVILPEIYLNIYPLSPDRIAGSDTTLIQSDDTWYTSSAIVDGTGGIICNKYHELRFFRREDGSYYPYGLARLAVNQGEVVHYFLIDWDGQPLNETPFDEVEGFADGVFIVEINDQEVRYSAETGERLS